MNCQIFERVVNDLARDQVMEPDAREDALAHSRVCKECGVRLSLERRLTSGLRSLAAQMMCVSASARVEAELLEAFRSQAPLPKARPVDRNRYWLAAAVVLIVFGIAGLKWRLDGQSQSIGSIAIGDSPKAVAVGGQEEALGIPETQSFRPRRKAAPRSVGKRPSRKEASLAQGRAGQTNTSEIVKSDDSEVTSQFLPLSYASAASLQDGGQLVRVEMSRSAMVSFGLPVNMERYGERVKADVLVSADGMARAIRFVQ